MVLHRVFVHHPVFNVSEPLSSAGMLCAELFDNYMQQDAHEFLNYLLNTVADLLQGKTKPEMTWTFCSFPVSQLALLKWLTLNTVWKHL